MSCVLYAVWWVVVACGVQYEERDRQKPAQRLQATQRLRAREKTVGTCLVATEHFVLSRMTGPLSWLSWSLVRHLTLLPSSQHDLHYPSRDLRPAPCNASLSLFFSLCPSLSVCVCLSDILFVSLSLFLPLCLFLCLSVSVSFSVSLSLFSVSVSVSLSFFVSHSLFVSVSLSVSLFVSLSLCLSLCFSLSPSVVVCVNLCLFISSSFCFSLFFTVSLWLSVSACVCFSLRLCTNSAIHWIWNSWNL